MLDRCLLNPLGVGLGNGAVETGLLGTGALGVGLAGWWWWFPKQCPAKEMPSQVLVGVGIGVGVGLGV
jgi:hypothetical protein